MDQQQGQHVRKAEPAPDAAAHTWPCSGTEPHNVLDRPGGHSVGVGVEAGMLFDLAQGHHGADGELILGLLDGVQPQTAQVDGGADIAVFIFIQSMPPRMRALRFWLSW